MIPLVVCRAYDADDIRGACVLMGAAILIGAVTARLTKPMGAWTGRLVAILVPVAALTGFWPFDPSWKDDCYVTPDPSLLVMGACVLFPFVLCGAFFVVRRVERAFGKSGRDVRAG